MRTRIVCFVLLVGCAPRALVVAEVAARPPQLPGSPVTQCSPTAHGPAVGGVLNAEFVTAVLGEVETVVAVAVCNCAHLLGHAAPGEVRVGVSVDPSRGRIETDRGVTVSFELIRWERGRLAGVDNSHVAACVAASLENIALTPRALGTCADPGGTGGRLMSTVRVDVR